MRARYINEKFTEDSDPIKDMEIGSIRIAKREAEKFINTYNSAPRVAAIYFNNSNYTSPAYILYYFFKHILNGFNIQDAFYKALKNEDWHIKSDTIMEFRKTITDAIKKHHNIDVDPNDPRLP